MITGYLTLANHIDERTRAGGSPDPAILEIWNWRLDEYDAMISPNDRACVYYWRSICVAAIQYARTGIRKYPIRQHAYRDSHESPDILG